MKTVLIPTDFNLTSLEVIDALLIKHPTEKFKIVLFHAFKFSDSITDLLMLSRRSRDYEQISDDFYFKLEGYKQKYAEQVQRVEISYYYGTTVASFRNFAENINPNFIACATDYEFQAVNKYSFNPVSLIERSKCEVEHLSITLVNSSENLYESRIPTTMETELIPNF